MPPYSCRVATWLCELVCQALKACLAVHIGGRVYNKIKLHAQASGGLRQQSIAILQPSPASRPDALWPKIT